MWNEIITNCVELAHSNAQDIKRQLEFAGVTYVEGLAAFPDSGGADSLSVETPGNMVEIIKAEKYLLATGSKPFRPGGIPFDGKRMFDSDSINQIGFLPKSVAITGSGIIAIEFAKIFRNLGAEVTLIIRDAVPRNALMKIGLDKDVSATLVADLIRSGITIIRGAQAKDFVVPPPTSQRQPIKIQLEAKGGGALPKSVQSEIKCDAYIAAVGRKPNTQGLNLEAAGIQMDEYGGILVNEQLVSTAKGGNVYAAGDVLGRPFLASTGTAQAKAALTCMFGTGEADSSGEDDVNSGLACDPNDPLCVEGGISQAGSSFDPSSLAANPFAFPCGVWSSPEAAYFGLSVQQAEEMGMEAGEGIALYAECLRGLVFSPNGLLKIVYEKPTGRILGVHICGDDAW